MGVVENVVVAEPSTPYASVAIGGPL
jgi:hypothetical protein